ncbi:hypothetical protein BGX26_005297 [Mortierella sp. AD094]|nr:hypothetical protein BGX26_005297 [Mortierella sp. AD094]
MKYLIVDYSNFSSEHFEVLIDCISKCAKKDSAVPLLELDLEDSDITLYQMMARKLWCKDAVRLQKSADGREHTLNQLNRLQPYQIDELMTIEVEYFGYLAFK